MNFNSLLPRNRTPLELQLEQTLFKKLAKTIATITADTTVIKADSGMTVDSGTATVKKIDADIIRKSQEVYECPEKLLPWLAYALSLDEWQDNWSEAIKRGYIQQSFNIHRHKGTPYAIKTALQALGYSSVIIIERGGHYYNGSKTYNAEIDHGSNSLWPLFDVVLNTGDVPDEAKTAEIRARINRYKNQRSQLRNLVFMNLLYNGAATYNGDYQHNAGVL